MRPIGPDPPELGGLGVESLERAAGDRYAVNLADDKAAVRWRELRDRNRLQPPQDRLHGAFVALCILDGQLVQQRLSPRIVLAHRRKTRLLWRGWAASGHH